WLRNYRLRQIQRLRNSIADDLHDDIGSTLSSISIMSELAKTKPSENDYLLASIGESAATMQENMSDIVWALKPDNDSFQNTVQRMHQFAGELADAKDIKLDFKSDESLSAVRITTKNRKNLYLFFKEGINNAVKHSGGTKIMIDISRKENWLQLRIEDDG